MCRRIDAAAIPALDAVMGMVEAQRFHDVYEAELAASFLNAHGIEADVADRSLATIDPLLQRALGGIRVMVPVGQLSGARDLLDRAGGGEFAEADGDDIAPAAGGKWLGLAVVGMTLSAGAFGGLAVSRLRRQPSLVQVAGLIFVMICLGAALILPILARR